MICLLEPMLGKRFLDFRRKSAWISRGIENTIRIPWGACFLFQETFSNGHQGCGQGGRRVAGLYRRRWRAGPSIRRCATASKEPSGAPAAQHMAARRLRSRHSNTISLIVADIRNPFFTAISRSVEIRLCAWPAGDSLQYRRESRERDVLAADGRARARRHLRADAAARPGRSGACGAVFR